MKNEFLKKQTVEFIEEIERNTRKEIENIYKEELEELAKYKKKELEEQENPISVARERDVYINIDKFCENNRYLYFFEKTAIKQVLAKIGVITWDDSKNKYTSNEIDSITNNGKLYISRTVLEEFVASYILERRISKMEGGINLFKRLSEDTQFRMMMLSNLYDTQFVHSKNKNPIFDQYKKSVEYKEGE